MDRIEKAYQEAIKIRDSLSYFIDTYEYMIMESHPNGSHEAWTEYKNKCKNDIDDIESIVKSIKLEKEQ